LHCAASHRVACVASHRVASRCRPQREFVAMGKPWLVRLYGLCTDSCNSLNDVRATRPRRLPRTPSRSFLALPRVSIHPCIRPLYPLLIHISARVPDRCHPPACPPACLPALPPSPHAAASRAQVKIASATVNSPAAGVIDVIKFREDYNWPNSQAFQRFWPNVLPGAASQLTD
jgi:hypothetical protein